MIFLSIHTASCYQECELLIGERKSVVCENGKKCRLGSVYFAHTEHDLSQWQFFLSCQPDCKSGIDYTTRYPEIIRIDCCEFVNCSWLDVNDELYLNNKYKYNAPTGTSTTSSLIHATTTSSQSSRLMFTSPSNSPEISPSPTETGVDDAGVLLSFLFDIPLCK